MIPCTDCQAPLSVGILQARILESVAKPLSRESSEPRDLPRSLTLQVDSIPSEPARKPKNTGVGSLSLLQGIFLTQELNQGLPHCRKILHQLSISKKHHQGSRSGIKRLPGHRFEDAGKDSRNTAVDRQHAPPPLLSSGPLGFDVNMSFLLSCSGLLGFTES